MKPPNSKKLANEQFLFRAVIRVSLVDPNDAAKLGDGEDPSATGYVQAFMIMSDSHPKAVALLEEALGSQEYKSDHPPGTLERVELTVLGEKELDEQTLELAKADVTGVLLRSNACPVSEDESRADQPASESHDEPPA